MAAAISYMAEASIQFSVPCLYLVRRFRYQRNPYKFICGSKVFQELIKIPYKIVNGKPIAPCVEAFISSA